MKRLQLEIVRVIQKSDGDYFDVRVKEQTHLQVHFGKTGEAFRAKNGLILSSIGCPQWKPQENRLFLRGYNRDKDFLEMSIKESDYYRVKEAVDDYNQTFAFEKGNKSNLLDDNLFEVK